LFWLICLLALVPVHAGSARVDITLDDGSVAEAEYWPGETQLTPVLIVHGFLATREFPTVRRLAQSLADEGHSVLLPTLTLGIDRRRESMSCEAIHTHSMDQDIDELRRWVDWLHEHQAGAPAILGHSAGGVHVTAMLHRYPDFVASRSVLVSLSYFGEEQGAEQSAAMRARALHDFETAPQGIRTYALSYCRDYVSLPQPMLSYLEWDKNYLDDALRKSTVPVTVIFGGNDQRVDAGWLKSLERSGVSVRMIQGANHFFDLAHEFDLLDEVLDVIRGGARG
jgi:pimeloyl-ACP methyl ester carboxylesterase